MLQVTMLERLLEQRDAVTLILSSETSITSLSAQQWATAAELVTALRPFLDITEQMSSATYPTLSMIIPVLDGLKDLLSTTNGGLDVLRAVFAGAVDARYGDFFTDAELCTATMIDPRFKAVLFTTDDRKMKAVESIILAMMDAVSGCYNAATVSLPAPERPVPTASTSTQKKSIWEKFDRAVASSPAGPRQLEARSRESLERELDLYLMEPLIDREQGCPYEWWAHNRNRFPAVAATALHSSNVGAQRASLLESRRRYNKETQ